MEEQTLLQGSERIEILNPIEACRIVDGGRRDGAGPRLHPYSPSPMTIACEQTIQGALIQVGQWEVRRGQASYVRLEAMSQQFTQSLHNLIGKSLNGCVVMQLLTVDPLQV